MFVCEPDHFVDAVGDILFVEQHARDQHAHVDDDVEALFGPKRAADKIGTAEVKRLAVLDLAELDEARHEVDAQVVVDLRLAALEVFDQATMPQPMSSTEGAAGSSARSKRRS